MLFQDITSQTFGQLSVVGFDRMAENQGAMWRVKCSCGAELVVRAARLRGADPVTCCPACRPKAVPVVKVEAPPPVKRARRWDFDPSEARTGDGGSNPDPLYRLRNRPAVALSRSLILALEERAILITATVGVNFRDVFDLRPEQIAALHAAHLLERPTA